MSELVERLREFSRTVEGVTVDDITLLREAAERIEQLEQLVQVLYTEQALAKGIPASYPAPVDREGTE